IIAQGHMVRVCLDVTIAIFLEVYYGVLSSVHWLSLLSRGSSQSLFQLPEKEPSGTSARGDAEHYAEQRVRGDRNATHERSWCRSVRGFTQSPGSAAGDGTHRRGDYGRDGCLTGRRASGYAHFPDRTGRCLGCHGLCAY